MTGAGYQLLPNRDSEETCVSMDGHEKGSPEKHALPLSISSEDEEGDTMKRRSPCLLFKVALCLVLIVSSAFAACCAYRKGSSSAIWTNRPITLNRRPTTTLGVHSDVVFGLGIGDVTGPIVEVNMMGYAALPQTNTGLHIRLRSRAFIVGSKEEDTSTTSKLLTRSKSFIPTADGSATRWLFINSDICMGDTALRRAVVDQLRQKYPGIYGERNVAFVGTHSHAGPGGFMQSLLPTLTSKGVILQNFDAIVEGTVRAAERAHGDFDNRQAKLNEEETRSTRLSYGETRLEDAHVQRSRYAYEQNPQEERDLYNDEDQDHDFGLLKFEDVAGSEVTAAGFLSWYAVHGTSLYENNTLTSGDNKGLAALLYETAEQPDKLPGQNNFVAGFSQALVGDTSPNTKGAWCDDGSVCEYKHSTCDNGKGQDRVQTCHGRGPAWGLDEYLGVSPTGGYDWASNEIIARKQVDAARAIMERDLSDSAGAKDDYESMTLLTGPVKSVKMNIDMSQYTVYRPDGTRVKTCPAALGYGFAGGTTDGPGAFDFVQGSNNTDHHNPFWDLVKGFIKNPGPEQIECQAPKAILLDIGEIHKPYDWGPSIVEVQMLRVGQLFILIVPGEFTTMAGRRLKKVVREAIQKAGLVDEGVEPIVQVSGPASTYGHYVTTEEEYSVQRYEGSSTLFGPHTLEAYMDVFSRRLVPALRDGARDLPVGPQKEFDITKAWKLKTGVVYDNPPIGHSFGDVLEQPLLSYPIPNSANSTLTPFNKPLTVSSSSNITVSFVAANPRNNLRLEGTYFEIQRYTDDGRWYVERTDGHHSTTMRWTRTNELHGSSVIDVGWDVEPWTKAGLYRVVYYGDRKTPVTGKIQSFEATSNEFYVV
ncbi:Neutral/alkaline nonlysosomal ceramidase [Kalmanozyma brasiliensis GHG001]|uniref:Neutral ceramidase n=1 Tax=Kalmanozyma brasiliensis (strain GHG001) TaxID=1365824 RepID=V5F0Y0_KALBG|nr:Neutral/alkaline nonlysosomal ceramidase [Kalmanozyma brasiliensis GHG001]EST09983.1 Neutral/alkaline nonlysosomal ceramidase [Kalmanozyma brasiliensis GHG001]